MPTVTNVKYKMFLLIFVTTVCNPYTYSCYFNVYYSMLWTNNVSRKCFQFFHLQVMCMLEHNIKIGLKKLELNSDLF